MKKYYFLILLICYFNLQGCSLTKKPYDYRNYLKHMPKAILVLPPSNKSLEVMAPYKYISIITKPIAEKGYYVYPVAVIDELMKANGVNTPEQMHQIPLYKINEIIDPDAVLYITINDWGTKYKIIDSQTTISISAKLVDTDNGIILWQGGRTVVKSSSENNNNSIIEMLVAALVNQILTNFIDPSLDVARIVNNKLFLNHNGLLSGQYNQNYLQDQIQTKKRMEEAFKESN